MFANAIVRCLLFHPGVALHRCYQQLFGRAMSIGCLWLKWSQEFFLSPKILCIEAQVAICSNVSKLKGPVPRTVQTNTIAFSFVFFFSSRKRYDMIHEIKLSFLGNQEILQRPVMLQEVRKMLLSRVMSRPLLVTFLSASRKCVSK